MFKKDFARSPEDMTLFQLYWWGFKFFVFTVFHYAWISLATLGGIIFMFWYAWRNMGW